MISSLEKQTLQYLTHNARITWSELANELGISAPAAADRVRRLEEKVLLRAMGF